MRGTRKGSGTPMRRGDRQPCVSMFAQVSISAGDVVGSAPAARIFTIFEGTAEIQRMIIGRDVIGLDVR